MVRLPDVGFVRADRRPETDADRRRFFRGAPDLAVEVRSPSNSPRDLDAKIDEYLVAGTIMTWMIDPLQRIAVVRRADSQDRQLSEGDMLDGDDVVPGFSIMLPDVLDLSPDRIGSRVASGKL